MTSAEAGMVLDGAMLIVVVVAVVAGFSDRRTFRLLRATLIVWLLGMVVSYGVVQVLS